MAVAVTAPGTRRGEWVESFYPIIAVCHPKATHIYIYETKLMMLGWMYTPLPRRFIIKDEIEGLGCLVPIGWLRLGVKFECGLDRILDVYVIKGLNVVDGKRYPCREFKELIMDPESFANRSVVQVQQFLFSPGTPSGEVQLNPSRHGIPDFNTGWLSPDYQSAGLMGQATGSTTGTSTYSPATPLDAEDHDVLTATWTSMADEQSSTSLEACSLPETGKPTAMPDTLNNMDEEGYPISYSFPHA